MHGNASCCAIRGATNGIGTYSESESNEVMATQSNLSIDRPWGRFQSLDRTATYQVKRIVVMPGQRLSLQKHFRRAEHWVVVSGTASVTVGDRVFALQRGQHCDIALGEVHRLANVGEDALEIIEVQFGDYLGEDDIVRLEDDYGTR
jgi:mannose-6-phosphate isomerase